MDNVSDRYNAWFAATCGKPRIIPPPVRETPAAIYARLLRTTPRTLRVEGIPLELRFSAVFDTSVTVTAINQGAPITTDLAFTPMDGEQPAGPTVTLSLPGGPGQVSRTMMAGALQANSVYQFTVTSVFKYTPAENQRSYTPKDIRNYSVIYTLRTHGPVIIRLNFGRMIRFSGSLYNDQRPSIFAEKGGGSDMSETVYYFMKLYPIIDEAGNTGPMQLCGPFANINSTTLYVPPEIQSGQYVCEILSEYFFEGRKEDYYVSDPVRMQF